jgi:hypothetical protein
MEMTWSGRGPPPRWCVIAARLALVTLALASAGFAVPDKLGEADAFPLTSKGYRLTQHYCVEEPEVVECPAYRVECPPCRQELIEGLSWPKAFLAGLLLAIVGFALGWSSGRPDKVRVRGKVAAKMRDREAEAKLHGSDKGADLLRKAAADIDGILNEEL